MLGKVDSINIGAKTIVIKNWTSYQGSSFFVVKGFKFISQGGDSTGSIGNLSSALTKQGTQYKL